MVQQSFLKCGIANALDGAQDDALYEDLVARRPDPDSSDTDSDSEVVVPPSLFEESDTETEFEGFQKGVDYWLFSLCVLAPYTAISDIFSAGNI